MTTDRAEFHPLSEEYLHQTDLSFRKKMGQYFTPRLVRDHVLEHLPVSDFKTILDPACGSGEFLASAQLKYPQAKLYGWEIDQQLVKISREVCPQAKIINSDALELKSNRKFDLIIGNPPYFEFSPKQPVKAAYNEVLNGRCNIFSMFIKLGLDNLRNGGYLAFVVPPGMNNGAYFKKLRNYILQTADIVYLKILESPSIFHKAQQQVMVLILKKAKNTEKYVFRKNGITLFTPEKALLKRAFTSNTTLYESDFSVQTGSVVWNQNKENLTDSDKNATLLVWGHNIFKSKLILNNSKKPQYIKNIIPMRGPAIVVNRTIGSGKLINLKAAFINQGEKFLAENHVNVVFPPKEILGKPVSITQLKSICRQISSDETARIIRQISGNTQLSKTELWKLLPIKLH